MEKKPSIHRDAGTGVGSKARDPLAPVGRGRRRAGFRLEPNQPRDSRKRTRHVTGKSGSSPAKTRTAAGSSAFRDSTGCHSMAGYVGPGRYRCTGRRTAAAVAKCQRPLEKTLPVRARIPSIVSGRLRSYLPSDRGSIGPFSSQYLTSLVSCCDDSVKKIVADERVPAKPTKTFADHPRAGMSDSIWKC